MQAAKPPPPFFSQKHCLKNFTYQQLNFMKLHLPFWEHVKIEVKSRN